MAAVSDPVRWRLLARLTDGVPTCVCDLQAFTAIAPNLLSYHLKVLREAGLVTTSRRGRWVDYTIAPDALDRLRSALPTGSAVAITDGDGTDPVLPDSRRAFPLGQVGPLSPVGPVGPLSPVGPAGPAGGRR